MNLYARALSCLALLGMSLVALSEYRPAWAARRGIDWWSLFELREEVRRGKEREADLDRDGAGVTARMEGKNKAVQGLLAGRLRLTEAAARFRDLNATADPPVRPLCENYAGATEEERVCRQVIAWAVSGEEVTGSPAAAATRERL
ncbi:MAG TPA: hypothetical protein VFW33_15045, partial [Gemmataceae bacterium]|nr:hypothetical protein [Gemmataceae bacterium]